MVVTDAPPKPKERSKSQISGANLVSKRIDGSVGGRPCEIDQPPEEIPTLLKRTSQRAKGERSLGPDLVLGSPL